MAFIVYDPDPEAIQAQIAQAMRARDDADAVAGALHLAIFGLRAAAQRTPDVHQARRLEVQADNLAVQRDRARATARACAEAIDDLSKALAVVADNALSGEAA